MEISLIVAMAKNNVIGKDNDMPWQLPADLAYFKKTTLGKPIIMGRKTFESIGRALPGRRNIVISRDRNYEAQGIESVTSVDAALALLTDVDEVMIIGGGAIYAHCLASATKLYITHIDADIDGDTRFPELDLQNEWHEVDSHVYRADEKNAYDLHFCVYQKT